MAEPDSESSTETVEVCEMCGESLLIVYLEDGCCSPPETEIGESWPESRFDSMCQ